ncbi:MAG: cobalamin-binding protein [candidate division WOR-3 bacterium]|nr:cobalamin-binding protein [candidate division WOR-3 bacterium]
MSRNSRNSLKVRKFYFLILILGNLFCGARHPVHSEAGAIRCVSLVPSVTEIIYALGAESLLKGNTVQCDYPVAAHQIYKVGDFQLPELERIVALKPTIVFATVPVHARLIEKLRELDIQVYVSNPRTVEDVFAEIESVGEVLGVKLKAVQLAESLRRSLKAIPAFTDTPRVYIEIAAAPLMSVGNSTFINDIVRIAGGRNIFDDVAQPYPVIAPEDVVRRNPEVIIILHPQALRADVKERVGWGQVSAVRQDRVYDHLDEDIFFRPGPRVVQAIHLLAQLLHPDSTN